MLLLSLITTLLCAVAASEAAGSLHKGRLSRVRRHAAAGPQPTALAKRHQDYTTKHLVKRAYSGRATYYAVGLGACGWTSSANEAVVALAESVWNQKDTGNPNTNGWCGTSITISYGGIQKQATIVDLCPVNGGCLAEDGEALDLSQSLFQSFSDLSAGIFQMTWWVNGESGGDDSTGDVTITNANDNAAQESADAAWAAQQSSSSAAAAAWASEQAASSSRAAELAWQSQQSVSWESVLSVSWNSVMSTSWQGVLSASRASEASQASVASIQAIESKEAKASRASARSQASAASSLSAASTKETGSKKDNEETQQVAKAENLPDSSLKAINDVSLRLANLVALYVSDSN